MTDQRPVRVLGLGNVLMADDGLGPYAVRVLDARYEFADQVEVLDVGTPGLNFTPYLQDSRAVIVVDTVTGSEPPGTIKVYDRHQLLSQPPPDRMNPHQPGLREAMMATELTDCGPDEILVVGVVPATTESGTRLSEPVAAAVDKVVDRVVQELKRLGVEPSQRQPPRKPDIWWE